MRVIHLNISLVLISLLAFSGLCRSSWAQFDTETPTYTPTPKLGINGTPVVSTVWLGTTNDPLNADTKPSPSATPNEIDISDMAHVSPQDIAPMATATPSSNGGNGAGGSGLGKGKDFDGGAGTGGAQPTPLHSPKPGKLGKGRGPGMKELYEAGIENYYAKDYDGAIEYLKEALTIQDKNVPYYYYAEANAMLGVIYKFDRPNNALAHQYCDAALKIDPDTATAKKLKYEIDATDTETEKIYGSGMKAFEKGDDSQAIPLLTQVVQTKDPTTPSFYFAEAAKTLGIIYQFKQKDPEKAEKYYHLALKIEPKDELARHNLDKLGSRN